MFKAYQIFGRGLVALVLINILLVIGSTIVEQAFSSEIKS
jgi:hypothetical protein